MRTATGTLPILRLTIASAVAPAVALAAAFAPSFLAAPGARAAEPAPATIAPSDMAAAREVIRAMRERKWLIARGSLQTIKHPVAKRFLHWRLNRIEGFGASFDSLSEFYLANSNWPLSSGLRERIEKLANEARGDRRRAWFEKFPPTTVAGCLAYANAQMLSARKKAEATARRCWETLPMSTAETRQFQGQFGGALGPEANAGRLRYLLRTGRVRQARDLLKWVRLNDADRRAIDLRFEMQKRPSRRSAQAILSKIAALPKAIRDDPDFLFDEIRWLRRQRSFRLIYDRLAHTPEDPQHPERWWRERSIIVHALLAAGNSRRAYQVAEGHKQTAESDLVGAEILAGWIAMRRLKNFKAAQNHFQRVFRTARDEQDRSIGAYWLGRLAANGKDDKAAKTWFTVAAFHPWTMTGQLAQLRLGQPVALPPPRSLTDADRAAFEKLELAQAARLAITVGEQGVARLLIWRVLVTAPSGAVRLLAARLAHKLGDEQLAVRAARLALRRGYADYDIAYPRINAETDVAVDPAFILAIIRQESEFNTDAHSHAGARGLMQLLPGTARRLARMLDMPFDRERLKTDPRYNLKLGAQFVHHLLARFKGSLLLAAAAYNAGPGRIDRWLNRYGDPTHRRVDAEDWIVRIPYGETRNYVRNVLANYSVYRILLGRPAAAKSIQALWTSEHHKNCKSPRNC